MTRRHPAAPTSLPPVLGLALVLAVTPVLPAAAGGGEGAPGPAAAVTAVPVVGETSPGLPDSAQESDADDPAFWIHPTDPARTLVIGTAKEGGLRVYDLSGRLIQRIDADAPAADGPAAGLGGRYNNVDVVYGLRRPDGGTLDVAIASDRGRDLIKVWRIDGDAIAAGAPLVDVTDPAQPPVFPTRRAPDGSGDIPNPAADQHTAYGLTGWHDPRTGEVHAIVAQRNGARLVQQRLVVTADGKVGHARVRHWDFPVSNGGQDLRQENEADPARDWQPQFEGLVVDAERGLLFAGQEDVGLWRIDLTTGVAEDRPFYETRGSAASPFHRPESRIARDLEGLALFYGPDGTGYLVVSSQGDAHGDERAPDAAGLDDTFAVFDRTGGNRYIGSFRLAAAGGVDGVQECDGAEITSVPLPGFPGGLMVVQDGYNDDLNGMSGEPKATNFKYASFADIAAALGLDIRPGTYDPRRPVPRP